MITVHSFGRTARGLRVMWQCEEMGLPYRLEKVTYPPSEAYRALNLMGSVRFSRTTVRLPSTNRLR